MKKPDLKRYGIDSNAPVLHNPSYQELFELETSPQNEGLERGVETKFGAVAVETGRYTGRAPKDRYIVRDAVSENTIWWDGEINRPVGMPVWHHCKNLVVDELSQARHLF
ncbi:MAG: phosphoenolpyruvate carboxykinase (ATP), partial [Breznakibacter sp.]|nr:phosphoenolpyruvate carboxykinase (ATP) [Breznakibacter sp.]